MEATVGLVVVGTATGAVGVGFVVDGTVVDGAVVVDWAVVGGSVVGIVVVATVVGTVVGTTVAAVVGGIVGGCSVVVGTVVGVVVASVVVNTVGVGTEVSGSVATITVEAITSSLVLCGICPNKLTTITIVKKDTPIPRSCFFLGFFLIAATNRATAKPKKPSKPKKHNIPISTGKGSSAYMHIAIMKTAKDTPMPKRCVFLGFFLIVATNKDTAKPKKAKKPRKNTSMAINIISRRFYHYYSKRGHFCH